MKTEFKDLWDRLNDYMSSGLSAEECRKIGKAIYRNGLTVDKLLDMIEREVKK